MGVGFGVLGPLQVERDGEPVVITAAKQRGIIAVLLAEANTVVSVDRLVDVLWSGEPPAQAVGSLQAYVSHLRKALEPTRARRGEAQVLVSRPPGYLLAVEPGQLDADVFVDLVQRGRSAISAGRFADGEAAAQAALDLWRGDAFGEHHDEPWAVAAASRLEAQWHRAQRVLAEAKLWQGRHGEVVPDLLALAQRHPLDEPYTALLMAALYRCGRQADALAAFAGLRAALDEVGLEPIPSMFELERSILAQDPQLTWDPADAVAVAAERAASAVPLAEARPLPSTVIGRGPAQAALRTAWSDATARGQGALVLVAGEAGIGKTTLVDDLCAAVGEEGIVLTARAVEGDGVPGFWLWSQVFDRLVAATGGDADLVVERAVIDRSSLGPIVPGWASAADSAGSAPAAVQFRVCESLTALLLREARDHPLLLVLEDLHWADGGSLRMLEHLTREVSGSPILVLATYRDDEVVPAHPLTATLATLARSGPQRVGLTRFEASDVEAYVTGIAGQPTDPLIAAIVHERTSGNPFFVAELTRFLATHGWLTDVDAARASPVPDGVGDVIRQRLARLPDQSNAMLSMAAVLGEEFDLAVLEAMSGTTDEAVDDALEMAYLTGVVQDADTRGRARFAHALIRQALHDALPARRRERLHVRAADASSDVYAIARHTLAAADLLGADVVVPRVRAAVSASRITLDIDSSDELLARTKSWLQTLPESPERLRHEAVVQERIARNALWSQSSNTAEAFRESRALHARLGSERELVMPLLGLSIAHRMRGDLAESMVVAAEILALGHKLDDDSVRYVGSVWVGSLALDQGRPLLAIEQLREAGLVEDAVTPGLRDQLHNYHLHTQRRYDLGFAEWLAGVEGWADTVRPARAERRAAPDTVVFLSAQLSLDRLQLVEGLTPAEARDLITEVELAADTVVGGRSHLSAPWVRMLGAWARHVSGDGDRRAEMAATVPEMVGSGIPMALAVLAGLHLDHDDTRAAAEVLRQALTVARASGERFWEPEVLRLQSEVARRAGDAEAALTLLEEAAALATEQGSARLRQRAETARAALV